MKSKNKRQQGFQREQLVYNYLKKQGYTIIGTNLYMGHKGEIDIICRSPESCIIFVEVRSQMTDTIHPSQILGENKLRRLKFLARLWLKTHKLPEYETDWRIDLIVISNNTRISWYKFIC